MNKALRATLLAALVMSVLVCENSQLTLADLEEDAPGVTPTPSTPTTTPITTPTTTTPTVPVSNNIPAASTRPATNYPARVAYVNKITHWWGDNIAQDLGVPGMAPAHDYNYFKLAFWMCDKKPVDIALLWQNAYSYFGGINSFGNSNQEVQAGIRKRYNDAGVKLLISTFGATHFPTTEGYDATQCGSDLGDWVLANNMDGADIDWEDNNAMNAGTGEQWLIDFTIALRKKIPNHIVIHAPQAPYFKEEYYRNGAYITVDKAVGHLIDFYFIQFYNQGNTQYNTYEELFTHATGVFSGTSVQEIANRGVPLEKLIVGKPILPTDATNTGFVDQETLGVWAARAYDDMGWFGGIGHWQYSSDKTGNAIRLSAGPLKLKCETNKNCH